MEKTLYQINEEYLGILAQIEENEGELTPELEQALAINEENHAAKLEAYGNIISNYKAEAEACKAEAERLKAKAERAKKAAERLKDTIRYFLTVTDRRKVAAGLYSFSLRDSKAVNVTDESLLPEEFWRVKTTREVAKTDIKAAIEAGQEVPGAEIVTNTSLTIK